MLTDQEKTAMDMADALLDVLLGLPEDHQLDHSSHTLSVRDIRSRVLARADRREIANDKP